jgi:ribulose-phosphate 3-epimerase
MAEIIPAILPTSLRDLEEKIGIILGHISTVHVDVTDATLTKTSNWPYRNVDANWESIMHEDAGLPHWEDVNFEAHLMVNEPGAKCEEWIRAGVERIIIHAEAFHTDEELSSLLNKLRGQFGEADHLKIEIGLALNFETPVSRLSSHVFECDFVHLMSIRNIGVQGEPFEEGIFDKIREVKLLDPNIIIAVDGGVSLENAGKLADAGVERLIVGSKIFNEPDPMLALEDLIAEVE